MHQSLFGLERANPGAARGHLGHAESSMTKAETPRAIMSNFQFMTLHISFRLSFAIQPTNPPSSITTGCLMTQLLLGTPLCHKTGVALPDE